MRRRSLSIGHPTRAPCPRPGRLPLRHALPPQESNTGDKLRSGARVHAVSRRGHSAAPPAERRLRREGWCRRKLRQLHPLVLRRRGSHPPVVRLAPCRARKARLDLAALPTVRCSRGTFCQLFRRAAYVCRSVST